MLKKWVATALVAVAMGAQAQSISFADGEASFSRSVTARGSNTYTYSFTGLAAGIYNVVGSITGLNFNMSSATFNNMALTIDSHGRFSFAEIEYTGLSPFVLTITGSRTGNGASTLSGGLVAAVSPVPEPESIAMMLAGLGVIGAVVRRRSRKSALVAAAAA